MGDGLKRAFAAARATRTTKQPIAWHNECHKNAAASLAHRRREVERMTAALEQSERDLSFYETQIATATARKMEAFDRGRFLVKRTR